MLLSSDGTQAEVYEKQGSLALEREWATQSWALRLFGTILGMIVVDAFLAHRYESQRDSALGSGIADFNTFVDRLAYQLIHNNYATSRATQKRPASDDEPLEGSAHLLKPFHSLPQFRDSVGPSKRVQRLCSICRRKASFFCDDCCTPSKNVFCTLCGPGTGRECYKTHLEAGAAV
ncbi:TPA: hypothetical protein N0F65_002626 [Lagenidium giganteum]|uniref:Uncharacterized protein n=1 Tax=Lagenidium giganteum TaxID=4803 RepID=A0AAV2Z091_9STRA|nr:TPA: hypothetical protein N0F65_002626 [Lagenidium giganteum]